MADIFTVASLPGCPGLMDWGRLPRAEIIRRTRALAAYNKAQAEKILSAPEDAFIVRVVRGVHAQKLVERL